MKGSETHLEVLLLVLVLGAEKRNSENEGDGREGG